MYCFMLLICVHLARATTNLTAKMTFYGSKDNCPPGGDIAYPNAQHPLAGGVGTFEDPITFAGAPKAPGLVPGKTVIYSPSLKKYFRFEDICGECESDWSKKSEWHFDLWMGSDAVTPGPNLIACEDQLTKSHATFLFDAVVGLPVDPTPLFNAEKLQCIEPAAPCQDVGNTCGNSCQIPDAATCTDLAQQLLMNYTRFLELNSKLQTLCKNDGVIKKGTDVCMGGTCGD